MRCWRRIYVYGVIGYGEGLLESQGFQDVILIFQDVILRQFR